jgi:hypothetical protein
LSDKISEQEIERVSKLIRDRLEKIGLKAKLERKGEELTFIIIGTGKILKFVLRRVTVERSRTPQQVLDATKAFQNVCPEVLKGMPGSGEGRERVEILLFKLGFSIRDEGLEKRLKKLNFKAADAYELAALNEADPDLARRYPNVTHWKDSKGRWCWIGFSTNGRRRQVAVDWSVIAYRPHWYFAVKIV